MRKMAPTGRLHKSLGATGGGGGFFTEADKEVLVKIVKHAQWLGVSGTKGTWVKFLATVDRTLTRNHDPSKRPLSVLASFLETWKEEKDIELVKRAREYIKYNRTADVLEATEPWPEYPEEVLPAQKLARLTRQHPLYSRDYSFPSYHGDWLRSELVTAKELSTPPKLLALDCEMVTCEDGSMQVVRVCLVDRDLQTVIDTLVQPNKKVKEYKSHITGITVEDLKSVTVTQCEIQSQVKETLSPGTIVVGHSVFNDLRALHIDHRRVIDTAYIFPIRNRPPIWSPPLRDLCKLVLGYDFRDDDKPHDCLEDAKIPMKLALHCVREGLKPLTLKDEVDEASFSKLLIHKVPKDVKYEELKFLFPRGIKFEFQEVEKDLSSTSKYYSSYAVFASKDVANKAFNQLTGPATEDITGRLHKIVHIRSRFQHKNALRIEVVVRKMDISSRTYFGEHDEGKSEGSLGLSIDTKCSKIPEPAEDVDVCQNVEMGGQVVSSKRPRSEEGVEEASLSGGAKKMRKKKKSAREAVAVSQDSPEVEAEHAVDENCVEDKNAFRVLQRLSEDTILSTSEKQSVSRGQIKVLKKGKGKKK